MTIVNFLFDTAITDKAAFWVFARDHWLNCNDFTELIGIILEWMHLHNFKFNDNNCTKQAEGLYNLYLKP